MKIAILGWGSLVWNSGNLKIDKSVGDNGWFNNGPLLPIEFARISKDGRLTLVIVPDVKKVQTLYAVSIYDNINDAICNLKNREGCESKNIGSYDFNIDKFSPDNFTFKKEIKSWIKENKKFDAVIWTNLSENFLKKLNVPFTNENVIKYLMEIPNSIRVNAENYIYKAPPTISTSLRDAIEKCLSLHNSDLKNE